MNYMHPNVERAMQMQSLKERFWSLTAGLSIVCSGATSHASPWQEPSHDSIEVRPFAGDVVEKLGDNLMIVHHDKDNRWWFGTWGDGLYRYDGKTIVHITTKHGLSHNRIDQVLEDSAGRLFFNTPKGVNCFDGEKFFTLPESRFSIWQLMPGDLWFTNSKYDGGVFRFDGKTLHSLQLPKVRIGEDFAAQHQGAASHYGVYTIYRDKREHVWFGTAAVGVCRYDGVSFEWLTSDDVHELHDGPANGVRSIVEDHEGHFWFNTRYRYAVEPSSLLRSSVSASEGIFQRLPGMGSLDGKPNGEYEYLSIAKDQNNALWIATYRNGAYCFDGKRLTHYPISDGAKTVNLFKVYVDHAGTIWLGTHAHGVYRFNGSAFERFQPGSSN